MNTLLQAFAASPQFMTWLQLHDSLDKKSLISSLQIILDSVNGTHSTIRCDPTNPAAVIRALNSLGWVRITLIASLTLYSYANSF